MRILDTLSAREEDLRLGDTVRIYLCGVTVYDDAHIGHARTIIVFDVLQRYLASLGHTVQLVQNFTDVDDKIIGRAQREGRPPAEISERYIRRYHEDFDGLNVMRAATYAKATDHMGDMVRLVGSLIEKGAAYVSRNGVYFSVSGFPGYGRLSKKRTGELRSGARVEVDGDKRDPLDFALWKFSDTGPGWDSPWGRGRPGWHTECSAMSLKYLGGGIDIHGGGRDLIFPHHENEIAQSESHSGERFARAWMHVGMVTIGGEKMSKSLGNVRSVRRVLKDWGPNVIRLFCLSGHYAKPVDYSEDLLRESLVKWRQIEAAHYELIHAQGAAAAAGDGDDDGGGDDKVRATVTECGTRFSDGLENDLNTHQALSALFMLAGEVNRLAAGELLTRGASAAAGPQIKRFMDVLGLRIPEISGGEIRSVNEMIERRRELRRTGQYERADRIRDEIAALNIELLDHKSRTSWVKREKIGAE